MEGEGERYICKIPITSILLLISLFSHWFVRSQKKAGDQLHNNSLFLYVIFRKKMFAARKSYFCNFIYKLLILCLFCLSVFLSLCFKHFRLLIWNHEFNYNKCRHNASFVVTSYFKSKLILKNLLKDSFQDSKYKKVNTYFLALHILIFLSKINTSIRNLIFVWKSKHVLYFQ